MVGLCGLTFKACRSFTSPLWPFGLCEIFYKALLRSDIIYPQIDFLLQQCDNPVYCVPCSNLITLISTETLELHTPLQHGDDKTAVTEKPC